MKVKCSNCGKHFEYDDYMGICPRCSTFYSTSNHTTHTDKEPIADKPYVTSQPAAGFAMDEPAKRHSNAYHIVTGILVFLLIGNIILTIALSFFSNKTKYEAATLKELSTPVALTTQDIISYDDSGTALYLQITGATIDSDERYQLPSGYEIVTVSYQVSDCEDMRPIEYDNTYGVYSTSYDVQSNLRPYLITKSGNYLKPLEAYSIGDAKNLEYRERDAAGISSCFEFEKGYLYFLVKKGDTAGLLINCFQNNTAHADYPEQLTAAYTISDLEVN